jgi:hypothetical protein
MCSIATRGWWGVRNLCQAYAFEYGKNLISGTATNLYGPNDKPRIGLKSGNRDAQTGF